MIVGLLSVRKNIYILMIMKKGHEDNSFMAFRFRNTTMDGSTKYGYWYGIAWLVLATHKIRAGAPRARPYMAGWLFSIHLIHL